MNETTPIILYTSRFCPLAFAVERFMADYEVPVRLINIDRDPEARQALTALNGGYASVPTLIIPDGSKLVEPSIRQVRDKLDIQADGWLDRITGFWR